MNLFKAATTVCCVALVGMSLTPGVKASEFDKRTVITFSAPVEIPGVHLPGWGVLPAGTYVFKILDSQSNRHVVQIFSADEKTIYATILAIPNYRLKVTGKTVITFRERPAGQPEALRAWFYPGAESGEEFVYSKSKAIELAKSTNTAVLFTPDEIPVEAAEPVRTVDAPVVAQLYQAPVRAIRPTGEEIELAQVETPPAGIPVASAALPATASPLPLIALFGMLALTGAFAVRKFANGLQ